MAQNLFEKYGIKDVADVTLFRIERKEQTFESQRKINISAILKGALEKTTVYPLVDGKGDTNGFEAYVFKNAEILNHYNYDCDDIIKVRGTMTRVFESEPDKAALIAALSDVTGVKVYDESTGLEVTTKLANGYEFAADSSNTSVTSVIEGATSGNDTTYTVTFSTEIANTAQAATGIYSNANATTSDADYETVGTHEFTYAQQVCMLYAKNQDLITKTGTRYQFGNADELFAGFEFNDEFTVAPNSTEKIVVVGLSGKVSENLYEISEVDSALKEMTTSIEAKAYDVTYSDYAELIVENEMGFYVPNQLGSQYDKATETLTYFAANGYKTFANAGKGIDLGILNAVHTWGNDTHYSINDAIDALKQEAKLIDANENSNTNGYTKAFGGYRVTGEGLTTPFTDAASTYNSFTVNGQAVKDMTTQEAISAAYTLEDVLAKLSTADFDGVTGQLKIKGTSPVSNRAIYVSPENGATANRANIYLLRNVNSSLATDRKGIFEFVDKKGNKLYYQDVVFAGTQTLALVTIGAVGLVFVVNRYATKKFVKTGWMINEGGFLTDAQTKKIVENGLIHTVSVTENEDTFDATCTVADIKVRKIKKTVFRYVPVLHLDTLKVSTIEQASESTSATGGTGNGKLMTWDYGKTITLSLEDALFTPASMSAVWGGGDSISDGIKETSYIDRFIPFEAKRNFIVPAGNQDGVPSEGDMTAQAVYYDPATMKPFQDGTPIAAGETILKFTRSVAYTGNSLGTTIEVSADKFPGTYKVIGETAVKDKTTGKDERFQFIIPEAKMSAESTSITLDAAGDPVVFSFKMDVLRPDNGVMMKFVQFDVEENTVVNDGSTMVKGTEVLNNLDEAEMYKVSGSADESVIIGATEY